MLALACSSVCLLLVNNRGDCRVIVPACRDLHRNATNAIGANHGRNRRGIITIIFILDIRVGGDVWHWDDIITGCATHHRYLLGHTTGAGIDPTNAFFRFVQRDDYLRYSKTLPYEARNIVTHTERTLQGHRAAEA